MGKKLDLMFTNKRVCELLLTAYINIKDDKKKVMTHVEVAIHSVMPKSGIVFLYYQLKSRFPLQKG